MTKQTLIGRTALLSGALRTQMTFMQRIRRIRCWWRGYHVGEPKHIQYKFRYDVSGMCHDCGKVGSGKKWTDGE